MERGRRVEGYEAAEDRFGGYEVYDNAGEKIGRVDDLFVDGDDRPEYIGVRVGLLGTRSALIPMGVALVDEANGVITVSADKEAVKNGPTFDDDREITPEYERDVYAHYGLEPAEVAGPRVPYGRYHGDEDYPSGAEGRHLALEDLTEEELAALAGRQPMPPATVGSGLSDVSRNHDHYLTGGSAPGPGEDADRDPGAG